LVDLAAVHRLNIVHLRLTDDEAWRFEVKRYPRLTSVSASSPVPAGHHRVGAAGGGGPRGSGFYTQRELRDLVAYASRMGLCIVPEINVPGHSRGDRRLS
jgi:hexosaminidase